MGARKTNKPKTVSFEKDVLVTASELALWLSVDADHVIDLNTRGIVSRASHGRYWLKASVRGYCRFKNGKESDPNTPKSRREEALAKIAEAEAAQIEKTLINVDSSISIFCGHVANARAILLALPGRVPQEARILTQKAVYEALDELSQGDNIRGTLIEADSGGVRSSS